MPRTTRPVRPVGIFMDRDTHLWVVTSTTRRPICCATWTAAMSVAARILRDLAATVTPAPAYQSRRRLQSLQAQGYTPTQLADYLGTTAAQVTRWCTDEYYAVTSPTMSRRIRELYTWIDRHTGGKILPTGPTPDASTHRWCPPAAWIDIDDSSEIPHLAGTTNARQARRRKVPVTDELRAVLNRVVDDAARREFPLTDNIRRSDSNRLMGVPALAERLGVPESMIISIIRGQRHSIATADLDLITTRLNLLIDDPAAA